MTNERYHYLISKEAMDKNETLTKEEAEEGWHFCWDWDGLLIHKDDPEAECCTCK
jgi:hypothetical protein